MCCEIARWWLAIGLVVAWAVVYRSARGVR